MPTPRRLFLKSGIMATLCAGLNFGSLVSVLAQDKRDSPYAVIPQEAKSERNFYFTKSTFDPYLESSFRVQLGRKVTELRLVKVADCTPGASQTAQATRRTTTAKTATKSSATNANPDSQCFLLVFSAAEQLSQFQTIFPIEHDALGSFSLFLVETEDADGSFYYTATYNHAQP